MARATEVGLSGARSAIALFLLAGSPWKPERCIGSPIRRSGLPGEQPLKFRLGAARKARVSVASLRRPAGKTLRS